MQRFLGGLALLSCAGLACGRLGFEELASGVDPGPEDGPARAHADAPDDVRLDSGAADRPGGPGDDTAAPTSDLDTAPPGNGSATDANSDDSAIDGVLSDDGQAGRETGAGGAGGEGGHGIDGGAGSSGGGGGEAGTGGGGSGGTGGACTPSNGGAERCDGLDNDCDGVIDGATVCESSCSGHQVLGMSYMFCTLPLPYSTAREQCARNGMRLARITNSVENQWVATLASILHPTRAGWLGGSDRAIEGTWVWEDGVAFWQGNASGSAVGGRYTNWNYGEPSGGVSESCLQILAGGAWNDTPCFNFLAVICKQY